MTLKKNLNKKILKQFFLISLVLCSFSFIISFISLPFLPDKIAIHWDINSNPDNFAAKTLGVFLIPITMLILLLGSLFFLNFLTKNKNNIKIYQIFSRIIIEIESFFFFINIITLIANFKTKVISLIPLAIGILFIRLSPLIKETPRNFFIGFRTPWTLSDDKVWKKTNCLLSKFLKIFGYLFLFTSIISYLKNFHKNFFYIMIFFIISIIFLALYSAFYYKSRFKHKNKYYNKEYKK